jgi:polysaccharide export outer membrane protein
MKSILFCLLALILLVSSCTTQKTATNINYLENAKDTSVNEVVNLQPPVVQKGDLLSIKVFSSANGIKPEADAPYNLQETSTASGGNSTVAGFMVDMQGNIEYPQLGSLHVEGLTRQQVADLIKSKLQGQLTQPSVIVRFLNFKISVLGEVKAPGTFTLPTERVTILEAIGLSGDITDFGRKNNVMVVRENNGQIEKGIVDLTSSTMFASSYYRLQQNDVVFVESNGKRLQQQQRQETAQQIGLGISIITAIALILNFIK